MSDLPLVSICCLAYNHENYIKDCLEGFLAQKTTFKYEILIHDDASTDNTARIIKEYELKYPDIVKPIYQVKNQYSQGVSVTRVYNFSRVQGRYISMCEGDDFWIDHYKLQKQVDMLESNNDYGLSHGDCNFLYANGKEEKNVNKSSSKNHEYKTRDEIFDGLINSDYRIRTATVLFRKSLYDSILDQMDTYKGKFLMGDTPMWLLMISKANFCYIDEPLAVYRISPGSASRPGSVEKKLRFTLSSAEMRLFFLKWFNKEISESIKHKYNEALINYKLYNPEYAEMYSLVDPSAMQQYLYKCSQKALLRSILKFRVRPNYLKKIYNKIIR